jgi:hypothetical protein
MRVMTQYSGLGLTRAVRAVMPQSGNVLMLKRTKMHGDAWLSFMLWKRRSVKFADA